MTHPSHKTKMHRGCPILASARVGIFLILSFNNCMIRSYDNANQPIQIPCSVTSLTSHARAETVSRLLSGSYQAAAIAPAPSGHTFEIESKGSEPPHTSCNSYPPDSPPINPTRSLRSVPPNRASSLAIRKEPSSMRLEVRDFTTCVRREPCPSASTAAVSLPCAWVS